MKPIFFLGVNKDGMIEIPLNELKDIIDCSYQIGLMDAKREIKDHFMTWKHGKQILKDIDDVMGEYFERITK